LKIGILSDTHGTLDDRVLNFFKDCAEIWHAGDVGNIQIIRKLEDFKPIIGVYGNIDGHEVRSYWPEDVVFEREGLRIYMTHIGGYPGRYNPRGYSILLRERPGMFICGHSHILKVQYDQKLDLLHVNPGACGNHGWHKVKTAIRFTITEGKPGQMELLEYARSANTIDGTY
jgi:putative phosphoesterase